MMKQAYLTAIAQAWHEMNTIRARDGVPYTHMGYQACISQEYWDSIMDGLERILVEETGKGAHLHPALYGKPEPGQEEIARQLLAQLESEAQP